MSDEIKETTDQETTPETADASTESAEQAETTKLSDAGIMSIQGDAPEEEQVFEEKPETLEKPEPDIQEKDGADLLPLRHTRYEETTGNVEDGNERKVLEGAPGQLGKDQGKEEKKPFENPEGSKIKPPEGWHPGGPESGG